MEQDHAWPLDIAAAIGKRVECFRKRADGGKGMTVQTVSDRCRDLGLPLDRSVIAKLEKGLRQSISVAEVMVLGAALGVPPILLIFPIGEQRTAAPLPGREVDVWAAAKWFMGEARLPGDVVSDKWAEASEPVRLYRAHERYVQEWHSSRRKFASLMSTGLAVVDVGRLETGRDASVDAAWVEMAEGRLNAVEGRIVDVRAEIHRHGLVPPPLPQELAHLDSDPPERS